MKITDTDVTHVADLANLELTAEEHSRMGRDLNSILDYIDRLNQLDTANVPAMAQASTADTSGRAMRNDELTACLSHETALENAPETDGKFFKVPKVIGKQ